MIAVTTLITVNVAAEVVCSLTVADAGPLRIWPDVVDSVALLCYAGVALGAPLFGYWAMALDIRRYLRSLRRALVVVARAATSSPYWAVQDRPPCLQALELDLPCTERQVLAAYRQRVKALHPDRGGDLQQFLRLQKHFEQAMYLARSHAKVRTASVT